MSEPYQQADIWAAFKRGEARTLELLTEAASARVIPHEYVSGMGHMVHPDDAIYCCRFGPSHPIHHVRVHSPGGQP